jgi:hypothetical protein
LFQAYDLHGPRTKRKYILENGTGREVKIDFYENGNLKVSDFLAGKGIISEGLSDDLGMGKSLSPTFYGFSDSIIVIFDSKKAQIYYLKNGLQSKPQISSNILSNDSYVIESDKLYRYTFTEEDYENAEKL